MLRRRGACYHRLLSVVVLETHKRRTVQGRRRITTVAAMQTRVLLFELLLSFCVTCCQLVVGVLEFVIWTRMRRVKRLERDWK